MGNFRVIIEPDLLPDIPEKILNVLRTDESVIYSFFFHMLTFIESSEEAFNQLDMLLSESDWANHTYDEYNESYPNQLEDLYRLFCDFENSVTPLMGSLRNAHQKGIEVSDIILERINRLYYLDITINRESVDKYRGQHRASKRKITDPSNWRSVI